MSTPPPDPDDPYLWLEDVTGDAALSWVRERNDESLASLTSGDEFGSVRDGLRGVLDSDERIPYVRRRGEFLYNYWQDADHPKGLWRRTTLDSYRGGDPDWELLIDLDALAAVEEENWVWAGGAVLFPDYERALVQLSRGGADATVVREFDLPTKAFVPDGFGLGEAKHRISWIDRDTVFVGTDLGPGSLTTSGYPRVMRRWSRGTPVADAPVVFEAGETDVAAFAGHDSTPGYERDVVGRSPDFHTSERFVLRPDGTQVLVDIPPDAASDLERTWLLVRPRTDWAVGGVTHPSGSLVVFDLEDYLAGGRDGRVLFSPTGAPFAVRLELDPPPPRSCPCSTTSSPISRCSPRRRTGRRARCPPGRRSPRRGSSARTRAATTSTSWTPTATRCRRR